MKYSTVFFKTIAVLVVVASHPCLVMAGGGGENAEAGGSSDYLHYFLMKLVAQPLSHIFAVVLFLQVGIN